MIDTLTIPSGESLYIAGRWRSAANTESRFDRWTGDAIGEVAMGGAPEAAAAIYTADLAAAMRFGREAQVGSVLVNLPPSFRADHMPYGVVKSSGQGHEGVRYAVEELLHHKLIVLKP